jgi:hypothetical protein
VSYIVWLAFEFSEFVFLPAESFQACEAALESMVSGEQIDLGLLQGSQPLADRGEPGLGLRA